MEELIEVKHNNIELNHKIAETNKAIPRVGGLNLLMLEFCRSIERTFVFRFAERVLAIEMTM